MIRILGPGGLILFVAYVYAVIDVISTDEVIIRNLPKITWLFIVLLFPVVGIVAWFALGRPVGAGLTPGSTHTGPTRTWMVPNARERRPPPRGIEDRDDWEPTSTASKAAGEGKESAAARERRLLEWEAELKRREEAMGTAEDDDDQS